MLARHLESWIRANHKSILFPPTPSFLGGHLFIAPSSREVIAVFDWTVFDLQVGEFTPYPFPRRVCDAEVPP
jgi:hypothetical protein